MKEDGADPAGSPSSRGGKRNNAGRKKLPPEQKKASITLTLSPENLTWLVDALPDPPEKTKSKAKAGVSGKLNELITLLRENPEILHKLTGGHHGTDQH